MVYQKERAHLSAARCLDYNPHREFEVVSGGEDGKIRIWDLRNMKGCLKLFSGSHSHWVVDAKFNPHQKELLLSSGTDTLVNLWHIAQESSEATSTASKNEDVASNSQENVNNKDRIVQSYDVHEDSVYQCAWSNVDAWVFGSISYDGAIAVHSVPEQEKYSILLN